MQKPYISQYISIAVFLIICAAIIGGIVLATNTKTPSTNVSTNSTTTATILTSTPSKSYSFTEIAKHGNAQSCWTVINGGVYDVTAWISKHPGGQQAILSICGIDGSSAFNGQHGGQARPESELATFKIGILAKQILTK